MRQHPIPQNILDVEFKLFSKFSVKEFVYMALGIAIGSIFLFLLSTGKMPAIFAIPFFLLFAGIGLFFGLVKINDQKADTYLGNFIRAVTNPTLRVWRSKKYGVAKDNDTALDNRISKTNTSNIIGNQIITKSESVDPVQDMFDQQPTSISTATNGKTGIGVIQSNIAISGDITGVVTAQRDIAATNTVTSSRQNLTTDVLTNTSPSTVSEQKSQLKGTQMQTASSNQTSIANQVQVIPSIPTSTPLLTQIQNTQIDINNTVSTQGQKIINPVNNVNLNNDKIVIGRHNIKEYGVIPEASSGYTKIPNSIALMLTDTEKNPVSKAVVIIKDKQKKILLVKVSGKSGEVITNKSFTPSNYFIEISHDNYTFPQIEFILEKGIFPAFKIIGKNNLNES